MILKGCKDSSEMLKNYTELEAWQKSYGLCLDLYRITKKIPNGERYAPISQIKSLEKKHSAP